MFNQIYNTLIANNGYHLILRGLGYTVLIALCAIVIGTALGCLSALMKISRSRLLQRIAGLYTTVIRGIPVVTQLMLFAFVLFGPMRMTNKVLTAIIGFGINSGAYCCEIFRAGIQGVDRGQTEAGRSLGLTHWQTLRKIVLPQAARAALPTYTSEFIALLKETSVASFIAVTDLTKTGDMLRNATNDAWVPLITVALIYLAMTLILTRVFGVLERRLARSDRG